MERIAGIAREVGRIVAPIVGLFAYSMGASQYGVVEPPRLAPVDTLFEARIEGTRPGPRTSCAARHPMTADRDGP
jgi:hypothetical protein